MSEMQGLIRHLLTTVGGGLLANGALTADDISALAGAIATAVGVIWSIVAKRMEKA